VLPGGAFSLRGYYSSLAGSGPVSRKLFSQSAWKQIFWWVEEGRFWLPFIFSCHFLRRTENLREAERKESLKKLWVSSPSLGVCCFQPSLSWLHGRSKCIM
jgi:hypothetical protein